MKKFYNLGPWAPSVAIVPYEEIEDTDLTSHWKEVIVLSPSCSGFFVNVLLMKGREIIALYFDIS